MCVSMNLCVRACVAKEVITDILEVKDDADNKHKQEQVQ